MIEGLLAVMAGCPINIKLFEQVQRLQVVVVTSREVPPERVQANLSHVLVSVFQAMNNRLKRLEEVLTAENLQLWALALDAIQVMADLTVAA